MRRITMIQPFCMNTTLLINELSSCSYLLHDSAVRQKNSVYPSIYKFKIYKYKCILMKSFSDIWLFVTVLQGLILQLKTSKMQPPRPPPTHTYSIPLPVTSTPLNQ